MFPPRSSPERREPVRGFATPRGTSCRDSRRKSVAWCSITSAGSMPRSNSVAARVALALALALAPGGVMRGQAIGQGFELERAGQFEQAASIYLATLRADPTNLSALLGLERVLPGLNRLAELVPVAQRAAAASPANVALRAVLLRTYVGINEPDSAREVARRWAAAAPRDEAPYREWAMALDDQRNHDAARAVLLEGRRALGRPGAFGIELAALSERAGDWEGAAREWAAALQGGGAPVQLPNAASELAQAPQAQRERIAALLTAGDPPPPVRRLAGEQGGDRSGEHTSELQSQSNIVCRLLLEKKNKHRYCSGHRT